VSAHEIGDKPHGLPPVSEPLVPLIDDQLPQEPWPDDPRWVRSDIPAQHHEPDRLVTRIDGAIPRVSFRDLGGILQGARDGTHEPLLRGADFKVDHHGTVCSGDFAQSDVHWRGDRLQPRALSFLSASRRRAV
jgi:hypothetical protein